MDLDQLSRRLEACSYPDVMHPVNRGIHGDGFYPAAAGFSAGRTPEGGVMLLGRDWGTKKDYDRFCGMPPRDESGITWRNTRDVYLAGLMDIPVWCTNYLMGVRKNGPAEGNIAPSIMASDWEKYEADCWRFLNQQVVLQKPKLIVIFGPYNREDLKKRKRLDGLSDAFLPKLFHHGDKTCMSQVTTADHPRSLTNPVCRQRARLKVISILQMFGALTNKVGGFSSGSGTP